MQEAHKFKLMLQTPKNILITVSNKDTACSLVHKMTFAGYDKNAATTLPTVLSMAGSKAVVVSSYLCST